MPWFCFSPTMSPMAWAKSVCKPNNLKPRGRRSERRLHKGGPLENQLSMEFLYE